MVGQLKIAGGSRREAVFAVSAAGDRQISADSEQ